MPKHLGTLIKIAVTVAGIAIVLWQIDPALIAATLLKADPGWLLATLLIFNASLVVRAYRWMLLLQGLNRNVRFMRLVELYFVGNFFNTFLPTSFGGDVVRAWEASQDTPSEVAAGTVIVDRLTGLLALLVMALVALPWRPPGFPSVVLGYTIAVCIAGLVVGVLLLEGNLIRRYGGWLPGPLSPNGEGFVAQTLAAMAVCRKSAVLRALVVSVIFNLMLTAWWWTAARALGTSVSFLYLLLVIPILSVVLLIPSVGGLGPREVLAPTLFAGAGLSAAEAASLSLLVFGLQRISSLLGGGWYLIGNLSGRSNAPPTAKTKASGHKSPETNR